MDAERQYDLFFLNDYFDNDLESILPILKMYLEETPKELASIESCLIRNDIAAAKAATHKIKTNVSMLSIRDQSSFINDMHLLNVDGSIPAAIKDQFAIFKGTIMAVMQEIRRDFFEKEDAAVDTR
ncbi:MAG: hypothetical protein ABIO46_10725 [Chitinophagales bacterium]